MTSLPLVSIIVNCYNGDKFLRQTLDSVLAQTYTNWELVFWDNQSTDDSAAIVKSYADRRVRYFYAPTHTFLYEARGYAIDQAQGEFLAFVDVDDWWDADKLERQIELFADPSVGIVCANYWIVDEHGGSPRIARSHAIPTGMVVNDLLKQYFVGMLTLVIRCDAYRELDRGCDPQYHIIGDFDVVVRLCVRWRLACIQQPIAYSRVHGGNETARHRERGVKELESWASEMRNQPAISSQQGFGTLLQSIRYDYGRLYVMQLQRNKALREWWSLPWGAFKFKLLADILIPFSRLSWKWRDPSVL